MTAIARELRLYNSKFATDSKQVQKTFAPLMLRYRFDIISVRELTADRQAGIAAAEAANKLVIIGDIIEPKPWQA